MVSTLDQLGETSSADEMLRNCEATIPQKTARYIHYCDVKAFSHWQRGEFDQAVEWASRGVRLKEETNVDTNFDCEHTLALSQRDVGEPALALDLFLQGSSQEELLNGESDDGFEGAAYGNVGRCLQKMGRGDDAPKCFKNSFRKLEQDSSLHSKSNRAYARKWIAEVLDSQGDKVRSHAFYLDAIKILGSGAPLRVKELASERTALDDRDAQVMSDSQAARIVTQWAQS